MVQEPVQSLQDRIDGVAPGDGWGVAVVELLLAEGARRGVSDLHVICGGDAVLVRGRREGILFPLARIPLERRDLLIARLKVLARLPTFIRNEPQDGRIEWKATGASGIAAPGCQSANGAGAMTLRVSFLPVIHGENVVIRFPERGGRLYAMEELGIGLEALRGIESLLAHPEGTILLTGPSSSGKTTTMYAMLRRLQERKGDRLNMITIEDPVERDLGFCGQVQVNEAQGVTFERALRAALRQDPSVLMIGEIRDGETARVAVQAGMTGHLVISTLHAGRVSRVFTRLLSMGLEPYLVASALTGAVAQRLARVLCPACRRPASAGGGGEVRESADKTGGGNGGGESSAALGVADGSGGGFVAPGCAACGGTGIAGRRGIFELATVTEPLRDLILARAPASRIAEEVGRTQTCDLVGEGRRLVEAGEISREEFEILLSSEDD